jgi:hypothetical protein
MNMPNKMNAATKMMVVETAVFQGFEKIMKVDGGERFEKNLAFRSKATGIVVYISTVTGMKPNGGFSYLKLAVPPATFRKELLSAEDGILDYINRKTKINYFSGSNYEGFPIVSGHDEPVAKCYRISNLQGLGKLFGGLNRRAD